MARSVHGHRALLNLPGHHSIAAIVAEVEDTMEWDDDRGRYSLLPRIRFAISDCDGNVDIEFDIDTENSYGNSIHKIEQLETALKKFRLALALERERYLVRISGRDDVYTVDRPDV